MDKYFSTLLINTKPKFLNDELKDIRNKEYRKKKYLKDKEKNKEFNKERYLKDKEKYTEYRKKNKEYFTEYRKNNKEKNIEYGKEYRKKNKEYFTEYRKNNKEKNKEYFTEYRKNNKEKNIEYVKEYKKKYYQTPNGMKNNKKGRWKSMGLNMNNFEDIYNRYINTTLCDYCAITLTIDKKNTKTTRCLDHCHQTGKFRAVLCQSCNVKRVTDI